MSAAVSGNAGDAHLSQHEKSLTDSSGAPTMSANTPARTGSGARDKLGHRKMGAQGEITYKNKHTWELLQAFQRGVQHSVVVTTKLMERMPNRGLLCSDCEQVMSVEFTSDGATNSEMAKDNQISNNQTPPIGSDMSSFKFKTYAPTAFFIFRKQYFHIETEDFLTSLCDLTSPPRELSNPGASGSILFVTQDDKFIIKTVQKKESSFFKRFMLGYMMNILQSNQVTFIPKFFGLYSYKSGGRRVRFLVMENMLPTNLTLHQKFDLKGSSWNRFADDKEAKKSCPTFKDNDFEKMHPTGLHLDEAVLRRVHQQIESDCRVLESFQIMDYSFLLGIHDMSRSPGQVESACRELADRREYPKERARPTMDSMDPSVPAELSEEFRGCVRAWSADGHELLLFFGIIDILQSYSTGKKLEHLWKATIYDGTKVSVTRPDIYANRFYKFLRDAVLQKRESLPEVPTIKPDVVPLSAPLSNPESSVTLATSRSELVVTLNHSHDAASTLSPVNHGHGAVTSALSPVSSVDSITSSNKTRLRHINENSKVTDV